MHNTVLTRYHALKADEPGLRARDAAARLGIGEGALVAARADGGDNIQKLALQGAEFAGLIEGLREVGPVMTLTRNETAVHETTGAVESVSCRGTMGQAVGPIDLRMFFTHWQVAFLVMEEVRSGLRSSIQIFDASGDAVLKVYAVEGTDRAAWDRLLRQHIGADDAPVVFTPRPAAKAAQPDDSIDREALRTGWRALEHTHDFHRLLRDVGVEREQALRLAGDDLARQVDPASVATVLESASTGQIPIMCFVGSKGCVQIYAGPVKRIEPMGPWLNVLDPSFNLHLRTDRVASSWVVTKPTKLRGVITSLELFDVDGTLACQFFGSRPQGEPERADWRALLETLPERNR